MQRDPSVPLWDVEEAGADIERFIGDMTRSAYLRDRRTQAAVERKFEIVGEALNRLRSSHPEHAARIPDLPRIIGFRNILAHAYDIVAPEDVWDYARNDCWNCAGPCKPCWPNWGRRTNDRPPVAPGT